MAVHTATRRRYDVDDEDHTGDDRHMNGMDSPATLRGIIDVTILAKPAVRSVTVVEKYADVVDLVESVRYHSYCAMD
jgi:hypothetical protein